MGGVATMRFWYMNLIDVLVSIDSDDLELAIGPGKALVLMPFCEAHTS